MALDLRRELLPLCVVQLQGGGALAGRESGAQRVQLLSGGLPRWLPPLPLLLLPSLKLLLLLLLRGGSRAADANAGSGTKNPQRGIAEPCVHCVRGAHGEG